MYRTCIGRKGEIEDYKDILDFFLNKKIQLICANPDEVVARGAKIEFCAGAYSNQYKQEGGVSSLFWKALFRNI